MRIDEPDSFTYLIRESATGHEVPAAFVPLQYADLNTIAAENWHGVFKPIWEQIAETEPLRKRAYKIVCDDTDKRTQGLLFLGIERGRDWSLDCLLEAAPWNRHGAGDRLYRGVGKALIARVIAEHWRLGYHSPIQLEVNPRSHLFYQRLGFVQAGEASASNRLFLPEAQARTIFESVVVP